MTTMPSRMRAHHAVQPAVVRCPKAYRARIFYKGALEVLKKAPNFGNTL